MESLKDLVGSRTSVPKEQVRQACAPCHGGRVYARIFALRSVCNARNAWWGQVGLWNAHLCNVKAGREASIVSTSSAIGRCVCSHRRFLRGLAVLVERPRRMVAVACALARSRC
eukprot:751089-Pleurochrysis_carterae.AAC.3